MKKNLTLAWLLLALLACIWGSSFILMKKSLEVFTVNQVASMRLFSAFLFFIPVLITRWQDIPRGRVLWHCFVSGLLGNLLPAFLYAAAGAQIASSLSGLLNSMTPIFTLIVGLAFYQQRIHNRQVLGMGVAFGGSLLLIFGSGKGGDFSVNPYALLVVLATVMYGINLNYVKKHLNNLPSILLTTAVLGTLGPFAGIILFGGDFVERAMRPEATLPLLYTIVLGALGSGLATVLFYRILQITTPVFGSSVTYLIPIVAVMWGVADGERLTLQHYLGMLGILAGVYLVNSLTQPKKTNPPKSIVQRENPNNISSESSTLGITDLDATSGEQLGTDDENLEQNIETKTEDKSTVEENITLGEKKKRNKENDEDLENSRDFTQFLPVQEGVLQEEINTVSELLGITPHITEGLIDGYSYGRVEKSGKILLSSKQLKGVAAHEAFHYVQDFLLTEGQSNAVENEYRNLNSNAENVTEELAENFRHYYLTGELRESVKDKRGIIKKFFDGIIAFFRNLVGLKNNPSIEKLFKDIKSGKYKGKTTLRKPFYSRNFNEEGEEPIYINALHKKEVFSTLLTYFFTDGLSKNESSIIELNDLIASNDVEELSVIIYNSCLDCFTDMEELDSRNTNFLMSVDGTYDVKQEIVIDEFTDYLLGLFKLQESEEESEESKTRDSNDFLNSTEVDPIANTEPILKVLIKSLPEYKNGKVVVSSYTGLPKSGRNLMGILYSRLANKFTVDEKMEELQDMIEDFPQIQLLLEYLGVNPDGSFSEDVDITTVNIFNKFNTTFTKSRTPHNIAVFSKEGVFFTDATGRTTQQRMLIDANNQLYRNVETNGVKVIIDADGDEKLIGSTLGYKRSTLNQKVKIYDELQALNKIGFNLPSYEEVEEKLGETIAREYALKIDFVLNKVVKKDNGDKFITVPVGLANSDNKLKNIYNPQFDTSSISGELRRVIDIASKLSKVSFDDLSFFTAERSRAYAIKTPNYYDFIVSEHNKKVDEGLTENDNLLSDFVDKKVNLTILSGSQANHKGQDLSSSDLSEATSFMISLLGFTERKFRMLSADKSLEYMFGVEEEYNYNILQGENFANENDPRYKYNGLSKLQKYFLYEIMYGIDTENLPVKYQYFSKEPVIFTIPANLKEEFSKIQSEEQAIKFVKNNPQIVEDFYQLHRAYNKQVIERIFRAEDGNVYMPALPDLLTKDGDVVKRKEGLIEPNELELIVNYFTKNDLYGRFETTAMAIGDLRFMKDPGKRLQVFQADKTVPTDSRSLRQWLNNSNLRKDGKKHNLDSKSTINTLIVEDVKVRFSKKILSLVESVDPSLVKEWSKVLEEGDGAGFITESEHFEHRLREGKITQEDVKFIKGQKNKAVLKPLKVQYAGVDENGKPTAFSAVLFPLIETFYVNTPLNQLVEFTKENQIGVILFKSSVSCGTLINKEDNAPTLFNKENKITKYHLANQKWAIKRIFYDYFGTQLSLKTNYSRTVVLNTHLSKQLLSSLYGHNFTIKHETVSGETLIKEYNSKLSNLLEANSNRLINSISDNNEHISRDKLINILKKMSAGISIPLNHIESFSILKDKDTYIESMVGSESAEKILINLINKHVVSIKRLGLICNPLPILCQTAGYINALDCQFTKLEFYRQNNETDEVLLPQILLPYYFKEVFGNIGSIDSRLKRVLCFKKPVISLSDIDAFEVVGYLPESMGDCVALPIEFYQKNNLNQENRELTIYLFNYYIISNSKGKKLFREQNRITEDVFAVPRDKRNNEQKAIVRKYNKWLKNNPQYATAVYDDSVDTIKGLENQLLEVEIKLLSLKERLYTKLDEDSLQLKASKFEKYNNNEQHKNFFNLSYCNKLKGNFSSCKTSLNIALQHNDHHALCQSIGLKISDILNIDNITSGDTNIKNNIELFCNLYNGKSKNIEYIVYSNMVSINTPIALTMIRMGISLNFTTHFMRQPILIKLINLYKNKSFAGFDKVPFSTVINLLKAQYAVEKIYEVSLTEDTLISQFDNRYLDPTVQLQVLSLYLKFKTFSDDLTKFMRLTHQDKNLDSSFTALELQLLHVKHYAKNSMFNFFMNRTFIGFIYNALREIYNIISPLYILSSRDLQPFFEKEFEFLLSRYGTINSKVASAQKIKHVAISVLILKSFQGMKPLSDQEDFLKGYNSVPRQILQAKEDYPENAFLSELYPILQKSKPGDIENIRMFSKRFESQEFEYLTNGWEELEKHNYDLAISLVKFLVLQEGCLPSSSNFLKLAPANLYFSLFKAVKPIIEFNNALQNIFHDSLVWPLSNSKLVFKDKIIENSYLGPRIKRISGKNFYLYEFNTANLYNGSLQYVYTQVGVINKRTKKFILT